MAGLQDNFHFYAMKKEYPTHIMYKRNENYVKYGNVTNLRINNAHDFFLKKLEPKCRIPNLTFFM